MMWVECHTCRYGSNNTSILLVGNKTDMASRRVISSEEGKELADSLGLEYLETSAKSDVNVQRAFMSLVVQVKSKLRPIPNPRQKKVVLGEGSEMSSPNKCCFM